MNKALLVIDMQLGCFDGILCDPMHNAEQLLANVNTSIRAARQQQLPVIFIQHSNPEGYPLAPDTEGWQLHPDLNRESSDQIVQKAASDSFENTDLDQVLQDRNVTHVVVCGLQSEYCVTNTSRGAMKTDRQVTVITDAHGTVDSEENGKAVDIIDTQNDFLARKGATLITTSEFTQS